MLKYGDRIQLKTTFKNRYGHIYKKGQTGTVGCDEFEEYFYIDMDGYEQERAVAAKMREEDGEGPNIVGYLTESPKEFLERI